MGGLAAPAGAHVEPTNPTGEADRRADVGFVPTHGCGTAPTIGVDIQLPEGVVDPLPADLDGWTASVDDSVVTWEGGPLPDGDEAVFSVNLLLPDAPGVTLFFPTIQRCPDGESLAWIQQPDDGTDQSSPAPALAIVEATGPRGTTTPAPATSTPTTVADQDLTPSTTTPPTTAVPVSTTVPQATLVESESDSGGSSLLPILIALGGVIVVGAGAILYFRSRSKS
jgi:uncharacterized protein YcnI